MMRHKGCLWRAWAWAVAGFGLACAAAPGFEAWALEGFSRPAMAALHRLTAPVPFPLAEPLALGLASIAAALLGVAAIRAVRRRSPAPLLTWLLGCARAALLLGGALALLWLPAWAAPADDAPPVPDAARLEWLCGQLVDALNASPLAFPEPGEALAQAPEVAGLPGAAVKAARYPEWMDAAGVSGLFVPLTGEALVNASAPAPLVPFTAAHELAHLAGIADEGAANVAAWRRCVDAGGAFADSARLWALRYALGLLRQADAAGWARARSGMGEALARLYRQVGGDILPNGAARARWPGLSRGRGGYGDLAGYLAGSADITVTW